MGRGRTDEPIACVPVRLPSERTSSVSAIVVSLVAFACIVAGMLIGMLAGARVPDDHLSEQSKLPVRLAVGLVATMTALILGLVTTSVKDSFDGFDATVKDASAKIMVLDRYLARYGPEAQGIREDVRSTVSSRVLGMWSAEVTGDGEADPFARTHPFERIADEVLELKPANDVQELMRTNALDVSDELLRDRWLLFSSEGSSIPTFFLGALVFWMTVLFGIFGLFAPRNLTITVVLLVSAFSVSAAIFLILELDGPLDGVIKVSSAPIEFAVRQLGQ